MDTEIIIRRLKHKKAAMQADDRKYDGCNSLCRTRWYNHRRSVAAHIKNTTAIDIAVRILQCDFLTVNDIEKVYMNCFPECDRSRDIEDSFRGNLANLHNLAWVLENAIRKYLPAFKKEVLKHPVYLLSSNSIIQIDITVLKKATCNVSPLSYTIQEYLNKIHELHHLFCHDNDNYKADMKPILLSCCGKFGLKPNLFNFELLLDAAVRGSIHKDIQVLFKNE